MEEIEIKILNIHPQELEQKLQSIGAERTNEFFYRVRAFDFPGLPLANERHAWVRLRTDGEETELSYKQRLGVTSHDGSIPDEGMEEIEVKVSDFEHTALILSRIGMVEKFYQEKKRIRYRKGDIEYDIDTWPLIPPYLEIEGRSMEAIEEAAQELGFDPKEAKVCSATQVFKIYGINDIEYSHIGFDKTIKREGTL
jgi:adenylate cyclase class 2